MGRIDDALKRASVAPAHSATPVIPDDKMFVSPWSASTQRAESKPGSVASESVVASKHLAQSTKAMFRGFSPAWFDLLMVSPNVNRFLAEQFRRLAGKLHNAQTAGGMKVVMTTSSDAGEGKSMSATNLALVLSESYGRRVLLVDADLRRPSLHEICGFRSLPGLCDGLRSNGPQKLPVVQVTSTLTLLPGGRPDADPMDALTSDRMREILEDGAARFDWVIIDTPPVGLVPDASVLAGMVDAVLFVVRARQTRFAAVSKSLEALGRERIFGVLLNGTSEIEQRGYGYYYSSQSESEESNPEFSAQTRTKG